MRYRQCILSILTLHWYNYACWYYSIMYMITSGTHEGILHSPGFELGLKTLKCPTLDQKNLFLFYLEESEDRVILFAIQGRILV